MPPSTTESFLYQHFPVTNIFHDGKPMLAALQPVRFGDGHKRIARTGMRHTSANGSLAHGAGCQPIRRRHITARLDRKNIEEMSVGVAQNANYETGELAAMSGGPIMGRSYTKDKSHLNEAGSTPGLQPGAV